VRGDDVVGDGNELLRLSCKSVSMILASVVHCMIPGNKVVQLYSENKVYIKFFCPVATGMFASSI
jgi:hypothetical protein